MTPTLFCGGQLVMLPKFDPQSFIQALEEYKPNFLHLAPPLLAFCADNSGVRAEALQRLHHVMTAAAPTGPALLRRFKSKAPNVKVKEGEIFKFNPRCMHSGNLSMYSFHPEAFRVEFITLKNLEKL